MADYNFSTFDYLQVDLPDQDYTYAQVEAIRENDALNILFKFTDQADQYGLVIQDFDISAGSSFGYIPVTLSILAGLSLSDILTPKIDETISLLAQLSRNDILAVTIDNVAELIVSFSRFDDLTISGAIDQLNTILVSLSRTDTLLPTIVDLSSFATSQLSRSDLLTLSQAIDNLSILARVSRSDALGLTFVEQFYILWLSLEAFRFRNDDGNETTASWYAAQDQGITSDKNNPKRLRILIDTQSDFGALTFKLQYRPVGDPDWEWRDVE